MTEFRCDSCGIEIDESLSETQSDLVGSSCTSRYCTGKLWRVDRPEGLAATTFLSEREAEAYILVSSEHRDMMVKDAAEEMGIKPDTLSGWLARIRDKIEEAPVKQVKAEATADLSI